MISSPEIETLIDAAVRVDSLMYWAHTLSNFNPACRSRFEDLHEALGAIGRLSDETPSPFVYTEVTT
jgi:hypothetical protein